MLDAAELCSFWHTYAAKDKLSSENIFDKQYENQCCEAEDIPHKIPLQALLKSLVYCVHRKLEEMINHLSLGEEKQEEFS